MRVILWSARNTVKQVNRETYHIEAEVTFAPQEPPRPEGSCVLSTIQEVSSRGRGSLGLIV